MEFDFKNATQAERNEEYKRIAKEVGDDQFFTKKELTFLPKILASGEQIIAFTSGFMDGNTWLITLTDRRIIFLDKGMIYGLKQISINLDKINSISGHTGMFFGKIIIGDGSSQYQITYVWKKTVTKFTNLARDAIEKCNSTVLVSSSEDLVTKLSKLSGLVEKGILSEDEFNQQKAKLLAE